MGIRIDPTLELVWRDPYTMQLGTDPARAIVSVPDASAERFLTALRTETARGALAAVAQQYGCDPMSAARTLRAAAPALTETTNPMPAATAIIGAHPAADAIVEMLAGESVDVRRLAADDASAVAAYDGDLSVVVAEHVIAPRVRSALTRSCVPHLPVVIGDGAVRIGPILDPDHGPCLHCLELRHAAADGAWPAIATQLLGRRAAPLTPYRVSVVATRAAAEVLDFLTGPNRLPSARPLPHPHSTDDRSDSGTGQLVLDRASLTAVRVPVAQHPDCLCAGPQGIGSVHDLRNGSRPGATRSRSASGARG